MFILHSALKLVNKGIKKYLALDPTCLAKLDTLGHKCLKISLESINVDFYIIIDQGIHLARYYDGTPNTHIAGKPHNLLKLLIRKKTTGKLVAEGVAISGDLDLAQDLMRIIQAMDIDWHGFLSKFTGDMTAYQLLQQAKTFKEFLKKARHSVKENTSEYLIEEARLLVPKLEISNYCNAVTNLRHDVERLQARTQRLQKMIDIG